MKQILIYHMDFIYELCGFYDLAIVASAVALICVLCLFLRLVRR